MMQRALQNSPIHVAIIMDGNGRWARRRGRPRTVGHREGAKAVRRVVEAAAEPSLGIDWLTLYAFSSANWARPRDEVAGLMKLLEMYLVRETDRCVETGVRLRVIGRRDRLPKSLADRIEEAEARTSDGTRLTLRLAIDYSGRSEIVRAAGEAAARVHAAVPPGEDPAGYLDEATFGRLLLGAEGFHSPGADVDLLIRTGGEQRLSDFMLWECAYAELHFTRVLWPDFGAAELARAVADFRGRERRFGRVLEEAV